MKTSKKEILLFFFSSWVKLRTEFFLESVLQYVDFVDIISKNKDIINISYVYWRFLMISKILFSTSDMYKLLKIGPRTEPKDTPSVWT